MNEAARLPRPFRVLAIAVGCLAAGLFAASWFGSPPRVTIQIILLAAATVLSENFTLSLPRYSVSLGYPLTIAAVILAGPTTAAVVAALSAVSLKDLRSKTPTSVMLFNLGQLVAVTVAGSWVYTRLGGSPLLTSAVGSNVSLGAIAFWTSMFPLTVVAFVCALGNVGITGLALAALGRQSFVDALASVAWLFPSQFALAFVGFLIAQVLAISPWAFPLLIAPLMVARQVYQRFTELKDAYSDTVRSLVGALEAKDAYTRGHSERVADYSLELGRALGLDARSLERVEYSALLHDLGKLAVPSEILSKPGSLTPSELRAIREHPARGADMVAKIPPLRDLADNVRKHHEWYGGGGYPAGDAGAQIPTVALILAVADCYDAMITNRAYRPAFSHDMAVEQLRSGSGTQFAPAIVDAFIGAHIGLSESLASTVSNGRAGAVATLTTGEG